MLSSRGQQIAITSIVGLLMFGAGYYLSGPRREARSAHQQSGTRPIPIERSAIPARAAGCLIKHSGVMIGVLHRGGPSAGKFSPPAGGVNDGDENPEAAAARETLEETGLVVRVHERRLEIAEAGLVLFRCTLSDAAAAPLVPSPQNEEALGVVGLNPQELPDEQWRFPQQAERVRQAFNDL